MKKHNLFLPLVALLAFGSLTSACSTGQNDPGKHEEDEPQYKPTVYCTSLKIDKKELTLTEGEGATIIATMTPDDVTNKNVIWLSSNEDVATVDNGVVTAKSAGTARITANSGDGYCNASCIVTVLRKEIHVESISVAPQTAACFVGEQVQLTATVLPLNADNMAYTWSSSNESVAKVNEEGLVTARGAGTASIKAITEDGAKEASCTFTVTAPSISSISLDKHDITLDIGATENVTVSTTGKGTYDKSYTIASDDPTVATVSSDGVITAIGAGTTKVVVTSVLDSKLKDECVITVNKPAERVISYLGTDEYSLFNDEVLVKAPGEQDFSKATYDYKDKKLSFSVTNGTQIKVKVRSTTDVSVLGVTFNGTAIFEVDSNWYCSWTASATSYQEQNPIVGFSIVGKKVEEYEGNVQLEFDTGINITFLPYFDDNLTVKVKSANVNDRIVLKVVENEGYEAYNVRIKYTAEDSGFTKTITKDCSDLGNGKYAFNVPQTSDNKVIITCDVKDLTKFIGSPYVGSYIVFRTFSASVGDKEFNIIKDKNFTFDGGGTMTWGYFSANANDINTNGIAFKTNTTYDRYLPALDKAIVFGTTNYSDSTGKYISSFDEPFFNNSKDVGIAVRKLNTNDEDSLYTSDNAIFMYDGTRFAIVRVFRDGLFYKNILINFDKHLVFDNPLIEFVYGTSLNDAKVMFNVIYDDGKVLNVTSINDGGQANFVKAEDYQIKYAHGQDELIILNDNDVVYKGDLYMIKTLTTSTVAFMSADHEYEANLNLTTKEFEITKDEQKTQTVVAFNNYEFSGSYDNDWGSGTVSVKFDDYTDTISGVIKSGPYPLYTFNFTATYDASTFTLSGVITDENYKMGFVGKTFTIKVANGKITFTKNFGNSAFDFKDQPLTCVDFVL